MKLISKKSIDKIINNITNCFKEVESTFFAPHPMLTGMIVAFISLIIGLMTDIEEIVNKGSVYVGEYVYYFSILGIIGFLTIPVGLTLILLAIRSRVRQRDLKAYFSAKSELAKVINDAYMQGVPDKAFPSLDSIIKDKSTKFGLLNANQKVGNWIIQVGAVVTDKNYKVLSFSRSKKITSQTALKLESLVLYLFLQHLTVSIKSSVLMSS